MEVLNIKGSKHTPTINFDPQSNCLVFEGRSYPENNTEFYEPVLKWIDDYLAEIEQQQVVFEFRMTFFDSASSKTLMDLFDLLAQEVKSGKKIEVRWFYDPDDDAMEEYGIEFQDEMDGLPFELFEQASE